MAKKKPVAEPRPASLSHEQALPLIRAQRAQGQELLNNRPISSAVETAWETVTRDVLSRAFGEASPNVSSVMNAGRYAFAFGGGNETEWEEQRAKDMADRLTILDGLIEMMQSEIAIQPGSEHGVEPQVSNKVFLVHGHDERAIHETARFLEKLSVEVVILRDQPNSGRTIIEKFVDFANVGFAVVLLTGDDRGGSILDAPELHKPRARQNVILELGFFLGRLSRKRVCVLYQSEVEIPSDYSGVLYVPFDANGGWKIALAKEMKEAGLDIDMNKAF
jgi:predicted nucleotide-binding protein